MQQGRSPHACTDKTGQMTAATQRRSIKAVDMGSGKVKKWRPEAHEAGINALLPLAPNQVASGDDDGCVKLWDSRQPKETAELRQHTDYVSDFAHQVRSFFFMSLTLPCKAQFSSVLIISERQALY